MTDDPTKPPRFPYIGAVLCAACVGMAGYLWMRYSYAWDMSSFDSEWQWRMLCEGRVYGEARGTVIKLMSVDGKGHRYAVAHDARCNVKCLFSHDRPRCLFFAAGKERTDIGHEVVVKGRIRFGTFTDLSRVNFKAPEIHSAASRFTGASIAGLVVGAMGVFVFTVALRHWLGQRRRFRDEARA